MDFIKEFGCKRKETDEEEMDEEDFKRVNERADELRSLFEKKLERMEYIRACMKENVNDKKRIPLKQALEEEGRPKPIDPALRQREIAMFEEVKALTNSISVEGDLEMSYKLIQEFLQLVQNVWDERRSSNTDETLTLRNRLLSHAYELYQSYINPIKKPLQEFSIPEDILDSFTKIVLFCLERDYVKAYESHSQIDNDNTRQFRNVTLAPAAQAFVGEIDVRCIPTLEGFGQRQYIRGFKMAIDMCRKFFPSNPEGQEPSPTKEDQVDK